VVRLHSSRKHLQLSTRELLKELEAMYDQHADSMILHEKFRAREWRKDETFSDYMHEKIVLGNRVPIEEKQLLGYIIDIPSSAFLIGDCGARYESVVFPPKKN